MSEVIKAEDYGIDPKKANELVSTLDVVKDERNLLVDEFKVVSKLEITKENLPKFKELRLKVAKNRTQGINKWHKVNKEFFLTGGKFVDAIKRKEILVNEEMEEKLMKAEKHFENLEIERLAKLQSDRANAVSKYVEDAHERDLSSMDVDVWDAYFKVKKQSYLDKLEAERIAAEERQAQIKKEQEATARIAKENERLRKEQEEKDAKHAAEKKELERLENERIELESAERRKREQAELAKQAENDAKIQKERDERKKVEENARIEREKLQAELQAKKDAEEAELERIEKEKQSELSKGDAQKVRDLLRDLDELQTKYTFKSKRNKKMYSDVSVLIDKVKSHISK